MACLMDALVASGSSLTTGNYPNLMRQVNTRREHMDLVDIWGAPPSMDGIYQSSFVGISLPTEVTNLVAEKPIYSADAKLVAFDNQSLGNLIDLVDRPQFTANHNQKQNAKSGS